MAEMKKFHHEVDRWKSETIIMNNHIYQLNSCYLHINKVNINLTKIQAA